MSNINQLAGSERITKTRDFDVVVVGEINADLILKGDVVPVFGQVEQLVDDAQLVMGSSAVIFACGATRLGLRTTFVGKVGNDMFGNFMIESMHERGIDTSGVVVDPELQTGLTVILAKQIDRAILTYLGSIPALAYDEIDFELISRCRHMHLSSFFMLDKLRPDIARLFKKAKEKGLSISLDTNYDPAERWDDGLLKAMRFVNVLLPNDTEVKAIAGVDDLDEAVKRLKNQVPMVGVKQGKDGALAVEDQGKIIYQETIPVGVVDTVGAGDSFDAGFVYGYLNQWDLERILKLAVACGSLSTCQAGGTNAQPTLDEALQFIEKLS